MTRDVYQPPPPSPAPRVSRRALLGLGRGPAGPRVDYDAATGQVRAAWSRGGLEPWLRALEPVGAVLAEVAGVEPGMRVLELPQTAWREHDLQNLPFRDGEFDAVLSVFGAALGPRARRTAHELVRVVRPGGVVALTAWWPRSLPGRLDELIERPERVRAPSDWGDRDVMTMRLSPLLEGLELRTRTVQLGFPDPQAFFAALLAPYDLAPERQPHLDRLLASCNNVAGRVEVDARYLLAAGRRAR